jgi:hypothetical protein
MWYGYNPYGGWFSPWGSPMGMGSPMMGGWGSPYGGMGQMPYYPPWGGFGSAGMSPYGPPMTGGFGGPWMSPYGPPMPPEQEIEFLRDQAQMLKEQLDQIDARIKELEKGAK